MKPPFPSLTATWRDDIHPAIEYTSGDVTHHGETIVITGVGSGLSRETAIVFATDGAKQLVLMGRAVATLNETASPASKVNDRLQASILEVDVTDGTTVAGAAAKIGIWNDLVHGAGSVNTPVPASQADTGEYGKDFLGTNKLVKAMSLFWLFTVDDVATFVVPNVVFGVCGGLSKPIATSGPSSASNFVFRLLQVVFFNWSTLLVFDLANQRLPDAVSEDALNKPWRPIPRGLVMSVQARRAMLLGMPLIAGANYLMGVGVETALLFVLTWLYNDLQGAMRTGSAATSSSRPHSTCTTADLSKWPAATAPSRTWGRPGPSW
ncbi:digeranylgeranylglyceryl phosphate synthase protein [Apiospora hydei]|uniref:Digeranylgeranylglyceryl phosphate synthase protein n=1 Tax=Apiospora hydei TaxID=1337664 RepID=A0ABR1VIJ4_9PEZI